MRKVAKPVRSRKQAGIPETRDGGDFSGLVFKSLSGLSADRRHANPFFVMPRSYSSNRPIVPRILTLAVVLLLATTGCSRSSRESELASDSITENWGADYSPRPVFVKQAFETEITSVLSSNLTRVHKNDYPSSRNTIVIGLDADLTSASARAGEAVQRGVRLALQEINDAGGVLGRTVELISRDHRGNPRRGLDNVRELSEIPNVVAIMGGIHTPVALEELATIHEREIPFLIPWAAGTPLVSNGYQPNYVFRVSVRDEYAGEFLVEQALKSNYQRLAVMLEQTGWGRSNHVAIRTALDSRNLEADSVQWFHWGDPTIEEKVNKVVASHADALLLVANPLEGADVVRSMANVPVPDRVPVISHWGITASDFPALVGASLSRVNLLFLQSYSFLGDRATLQSRVLVKAYCNTYDDAANARDIFSPAGTAHAYELTKMLAEAIEDAGTVNRRSIRDAFEQLGPYEGMIRSYERPFPQDHHDALGIEDLRLARYDADGVIVPVNIAAVGQHD
ncbi:MAG: ABC transporter substrate-binding protein [Planctomycetota bacterium]